MIPIRDDAPRFGTPYVNYFLIALNSLVFLFEIFIVPRSQLNELVAQFGFIPLRLTALLSGHHVVRTVEGLQRVNPDAALLPALTSMFLHGGWLHLIINMWFLWIFGDNVEDYLGHFRYLVFYLMSGMGAAAAHYISSPNSSAPVLGASGAIAGVMGAYLILFPAARVLTLVPFIFFFFVRLPAWLVLGYWFVLQFLSGAATSITETSQTAGSGVAFWAHVGGFLSGIALIRMFPTRPRRYRVGAWYG